MCVFVYACIERAIFVCSQGQAYIVLMHTRNEVLILIIYNN